ncbi:hypothetical protein AwEntero_08380 [Enterobacterales bacterium]|nr:hypothetical protein AwEntero_08380 [Enterobacterales bacterium]
MSETPTKGLLIYKSILPFEPVAKPPVGGLLHIYPWSLKVLDYPADKYHAQRDENRADCKTEDCP